MRSKDLGACIGERINEQNVETQYLRGSNARLGAATVSFSASGFEQVPSERGPGEGDWKVVKLMFLFGGVIVFLLEASGLQYVASVFFINVKVL